MSALTTDAADDVWVELPLPVRRRVPLPALAGGVLPALVLASAVFWSLVGVAAVRVIG